MEKARSALIIGIGTIFITIIGIDFVLYLTGNLWLTPYVLMATIIWAIIVFLALWGGLSNFEI